MEILDRLPADLQKHVEGFALFPTRDDYHRWQRTADVAIKHFNLPEYYRNIILDRDFEIQQRLCRAGVKVIPEQRMFIEKLKCRFVHVENFPGSWYSDIYLNSVS